VDHELRHEESLSSATHIYELVVDREEVLRAGEGKDVDRQARHERGRDVEEVDVPAGLEAAPVEELVERAEEADGRQDADGDGDPEAALEQEGRDVVTGVGEGEDHAWCEAWTNLALFFEGADD
jgi:hypothetical protein